MCSSYVVCELVKFRCPWSISAGSLRFSSDIFSFTIIPRFAIAFGLKQERIKGTEKASPIHTLFHNSVIRLELFVESG